MDIGHFIRKVLFPKEFMINGDASTHVWKRGSNRNVIGFMYKTVNARGVSMRYLTKMTDFWPLICSVQLMYSFQAVTDRLFK